MNMEFASSLVPIHTHVCRLDCTWNAEKKERVYLTVVGICGIEEDDDDDEEETNTSKKPSERASQRNDDVRWRRSLGA